MAEEKYGVLCRIPTVCDRCKVEYGPVRGYVLLTHCLGCNMPFCLSCATEDERRNMTCQACRDDPTRTMAYKAGRAAAAERERQILEAIIGIKPALGTASNP